MWLYFNTQNWGPKPFRIINGWLDHDSFKGFVEKEWESPKVSVSFCFIIKENLRFLKHKLKCWNNEVFGRVDLNIEKAVDDINLCDELISS